jgi:hypothetical protein
MSGFYQGLDEVGLFTKTRKKELALPRANSAPGWPGAGENASAMTEFQSSATHTSGERNLLRGARYGSIGERDAPIRAPLPRVIRELPKLANE